MTTLADLTGSNSSFSRELPGLQLAVDSTSLGEFKVCPRRYYYTIICGYQPRLESVHLTFGLLMHEGVEGYHRARAEGMGHDDALAQVVHVALKRTWVRELGRGWISDHSTKTRLTLVRTLVWYLDQWGENDPLQVVQLASGKPAVELSFRFDSGASASTGEPWVLCGHLDRIARLESETYIVDVKTTGHALDAHWFAGFSPDNQFSMYCLAGQVAFQAPVKGLILDGAQVLAGGTRFQRGLVPRDAGQLDEWLAATRHWLGRMDDCAREAAEYEAAGLDPIAAWPQNDKSCALYGGCPWREVCSKSPASRQRWLDAGTRQRIWDPLQVRGDV